MGGTLVLTDPTVISTKILSEIYKKLAIKNNRLKDDGNLGSSIEKN